MQKNTNINSFQVIKHITLRLNIMCKTSLQNKCISIIGDKRCIISDHSDNKIIKQIKMEPVEQ